MNNSNLCLETGELCELKTTEELEQCDCGNCTQCARDIEDEQELDFDDLN